MATVELHRVCPHCLTEHDAETWAEPRPPGVAVKEVWLCVECGGFSFLDEHGQLRLPTPAEALQLAADANARRVLAAWLATYEQRVGR